MRLTGVLCKHVKSRLFSQLWENRRTVKKVIDMGIPQLLIQRGTPIYDGLKFSKERDDNPILRFLEPYLTPEVHHERPAYILNPDTRLTEGEVQAQMLINSLYYPELPASYIKALESISVSDQDEITAQDAIMNSIVFDAKQEKLPKRVNPEIPYWKYALEHGSPAERKVRSLMVGLNTLARSSNKNYKPILFEVSSQFTTEKDDTLYLFSSNVDAVTLSRKQIPLGDTNLSSTSGTSLPSMYPALPEMDLKKSHSYSTGTLPMATQGLHIHTINVTHSLDVNWHPREKLARAILSAFTFAAAKSPKVSEPQTVQCVYNDVDSYGFLVLQLNTTDIGEDSVRNQVWHEGPHKLYSSAGTSGVADLNPRVIRLLKLFYSR